MGVSIGDQGLGFEFRVHRNEFSDAAGGDKERSPTRHCLRQH